MGEGGLGKAGFVLEGRLGVAVARKELVFLVVLGKDLGCLGLGLC